MKHFDVDTMAGWLAALQYSQDRPDALTFDSTPAPDGRTCTWCSCGDSHHPDADCAHRKSPGVLTEIPHLMAWSVYRLAGTGGGSAEAVGCGMVIA